jgi:hypothetical protein
MNKSIINSAYELKKFLYDNKNKIIKLMAVRYKNKVRFDALLLSMLDITMKREISISLDDIKNATLILKNFIKIKEIHDEQKSLQKDTKKSTQPSIKKMRRVIPNNTTNNKKSKKNI